MTKRTVFIIVAAATAILGAGTLIARHPTHDAMTTSGPMLKKAKYQCSMHPQIVSDKPGDCPICGMKLMAVDDEAAQPEQKPAEHKILFYRHPMNPTVTSPIPAKDEMGMDYVAVYSDEAEGTDGAGVTGHAAFSLSTQRQQLIGVKAGAVERKDLNLEIRTVGQVAYDPDLYNALAEYREALSTRDKLTRASTPESRERVDALIRSSALRLRLMGVAQEQIQDMLRENADPVNLLLPGKKVWVYAQVYEYEADQVRPGQTVTVTVPSARGKVYTGRVAALDPVLNAATRTLRVRVEIATPQGRLKPESFVNVKIQVPLGMSLAIPEDAVLDTGEHQIVFVKEGQGHFEPREVELGQEAQGYYEILSGLKAGEEVVTSANFLIDSESRFRSALSAYKASSDGGKTPDGDGK